ncbi:MAG: DNA topoisomerase I [Candidatus Aenigmarchaeota archaeon]|nr:DNA topoisomerase I [Candidatus Aenigmarchaeota archaeon]
MKQLIHKGVIVPKYEAKGFRLKFRGKTISLTAKQEEMAVAWVRKLGTEYVEDPVFIKNFFDDFCKALGVQGSKQDFDFSEIKEYVEKEREEKLKITKEEKKKLASTRKEIREKNKEKYGFATVDGEVVELGNYMAEPSSIFMGRGKHPLRGKWKEGATEEEIILNLSPDAPRPPGKWKQIVWNQNFMWIARWDDKLRGKEKYVWLSDTSFPKQEREIEKFNKASELGKKYDLLKKHINDNLNSPDIKTRKIATACYLIDSLSMRVGDEKDEDEADTVGATTLTPSNLKIEGNHVKFDFLGKDSVRLQKDIELPEQVVKNLKEFISQSKPSIFEGVRSENVNEFLSSVVPEISAKVFRTYHASREVENYLKKEKISESDPVDYKKYVATMANLQAAIVCNHKRKLPAKWKETLEKKVDRLKMLKEKKGKKTPERVKSMELKIKLMKETKDYNLNTSLKSYIDPRIYYKWSKKADFDWKKFYSKNLQKKFSWVEKEK